MRQVAARGARIARGPTLGLRPAAFEIFAQGRAEPLLLLSPRRLGRSVSVTHIETVFTDAATGKPFKYRLPPLMADCGVDSRAVRRLIIAVATGLMQLYHTYQSAVIEVISRTCHSRHQGRDLGSCVPTQVRLMPITNQQADPHHRFAAGRLVRFRWTNPLSNAAAGDYKVVALLPARDGEFQYSIKSDREPYHRIVKEGELDVA